MVLAGLLLTRVVYTKEQGEKQFVIVDAGMTDLIRPTLYQAYHPIVPLLPPTRPSWNESMLSVLSAKPGTGWPVTVICLLSLQAIW
ncbi:MAG: hypothetical protein R3C44_05445 [Chloroflexota bacterium]